MRFQAVLIAVVGSLAFVAVSPVLGQKHAGPYDVLREAYAPFVAAGDPLGFPLKVKSLGEEPYMFWRGGKDLFFRWCKSNAADWLAAAPTQYVPTHGDLHLGNIGSYAAEGGFGAMAFGMVDFDDSARLPYQLELLQGVVTLHLVARANHIDLTSAGDQELADTIVAAYREGLGSGKTSYELLKDDQAVRNVLPKENTPYAKELTQYVHDGQFRPNIKNSNGTLKEVLRREPVASYDAFAHGLAQALADSEPAKKLFRFSDEASLRSAVLDVAQRTRLGSSGSQGLKKYFVLLKRPLVGVEDDVVLYLKQQVPAAAERSGVAGRDLRSPGERCAADVAALTEPPLYLSSWCDMGGCSYWVTLKEPWSEELSPSDVKTHDDLLRTARLWGIVAGAAHGREGRAAGLLSQVEAGLAAGLHARSAAYLKQLDADFAEFRADPRVLKDRADVETALRKLGNE